MVRQPGLVKCRSCTGGAGCRTSTVCSEATLPRRVMTTPRSRIPGHHVHGAGSRVGEPRSGNATRRGRTRRHALGRHVHSLTMADVAFTPNLSRHVECPRRDAPGTTVREVLEGV